MIHIIVAALAAVSISITPSLSQVKRLEEFSINISASGLVADSAYYLKCRLGKESDLTKGESYNEPSSTWLGDTSSWSNFPTGLANSEGNLSALLKCRPKSSTELGENLLVARLRKTGESDNAGDSLPVTIVVSEASTPTLTLAPSPTSTPSPTNTPTPTLTPSPTPTPIPKATYRINEAKDNSGNVLTSVQIFVNGNYIHHYAPETLTFCDNCKCDPDGNVGCGFGSHTITLKKSNYQDWQEIRTFNSGDSFEINPVMGINPTSTPTSMPTPSPSFTPTLSKPPTPTGEVLGQESASQSMVYRLEKTPTPREVISTSSRTPVNRFAALAFLFTGLIALFIGAFWLWYTRLR